MNFLYKFLELIFQVLTFIIIIRVVVSWVSPGQTNIITIALYRITEPILSPIRRILPNTGALDFAPMVVVIILQVIIFFVLPLIKP